MITKPTGIILDDDDLDRHFSNIVLGAQEDPDPAHPRLADADEDATFVDSEGFLVVAGDAAAPAGQIDLRLRRAGWGVHYGPAHSHNAAAHPQGPVRNAQRSEVRSALRWVAWP
eukprot:2966328-Pyramimonas_sp.AAC.1